MTTFSYSPGTSFIEGEGIASGDRRGGGRPRSAPRRILGRPRARSPTVAVCGTRGAAGTRPAIRWLASARDQRRGRCYGAPVSPDLRDAILNLALDERLALLDEVWALVRDDALPVPDSHARELRARLEQAESDGLVGDRWQDVRERLRHRK